MVRNAVVVVLFALAAVASAANIKPVATDIQLSGNVATPDAFIQEAEMFIKDLEAEVDALLNEAIMHHRVGVLSGKSENCVNLAFSNALKAIARVLNIIDDVRVIIKKVAVDFSGCGSWLNIGCRVDVIKTAFELLWKIKDEAQDLLQVIQESVQQVKECVNPPAPTTAAPTGAPTTEPTAVPTAPSVPTAAPTEAPATDDVTPVPADPTPAPTPAPEPSDNVKIITFPVKNQMFFMP